MKRIGRDKALVSRRSALKGAGVAAIGAASGLTVFTSSARAAPTKLKMTLPWLPDSSYAYVYVAKNQGFWSKRGLDVEISRGNGALTAAEAIHSGQFDIGVVPIGASLLLTARGLDLQSIGMVDYNATMGVAVMDDSPIRAPKDLEGKTVGQTVSSSDAAFFPVFCDFTKLDRTKITMVSLDANVRTSTLWQHKVDAITGFLNSILPASAAAGYKTRYFLYNNFGIKLYQDSATVKPEFFRDNRRVCEAFVDGLHEGELFHITRPEDTLKIYLQEVKEMAMSDTAEDFARIGIKIFIYGVLSEPKIATQGLGWIDNAKVENMIDLIVKYQAPPNAKRPVREKFFRTDFAGRFHITPDQWKAAEAYTKDIAAVASSSS
jgi:ABC-type nitrate/sulfonate/bicarbonate transport system substrate-binding protein